MVYYSENFSAKDIAIIIHATEDYIEQLIGATTFFSNLEITMIGFERCQVVQKLKTEKILDILDEFGVKTTFFMVDIWTQRFPELVKEIAARGHDIGNHSATHPKMSTLSREKIRQELDAMANNAQAVAGVKPTLFRPPYGDYNNDVVLTARAAGYEVIQWSVDSLDWKNKGVQPLIDRATKNVKSGDIVLFHNDSKYILDALPTILKSYREQGFTVVPISEILLPGETTIDAQGIQHPAPATIPEV